MFFGNIRFWVLLVSFLVACGIYLYVDANFPKNLQPRRLTQFYALAAISYLYVTLLASPLTRAFPWLPYRGPYLKARRALGVSAFFFAVLHARNAFWGLLGGFAGVLKLSGDTFWAVLAGITSLFILTLMAATAFDFMVEKLTFPRWKSLHRLVYLASVLIIFHAFTLGEHFQDLSGGIPIVFVVLVAFLLILETKRIVTFLQNNAV